MSRPFKRNPAERRLSFLIVVRNAAADLERLLHDLLDQDFPTGELELLIIDGCSTDGTRSVAEAFQSQHPEWAVQVLANPGRILASGWNIGLAASRGRIILRVDAHSRIPADFIRRNVERIESGEAICGGWCESLRPVGVWSQLLYLAEASRFGGGAAAFRNRGAARYVDTLAYAAYQREVFQQVGGYDERLVRSQDNEIHGRMKAAGFRFCYDPAIHSYYKPRQEVAALLKQKFGNGLSIGLITGIAPRSFSIRHYVPGLFTLALVAALLVALFGPDSWGWWPLLGLGTAYGAAAVLFSLRAVAQAEPHHKWLGFLLPILFLLVHLAYGAGTFWGLLQMPGFLVRSRGYRIPFPIS